MEQAVSRDVIRSSLHFELNTMTLNILKAVKTSSLFYTTKVRSLIRCIKLNKVLNDLKHHKKILFKSDELETGRIGTKIPTKVGISKVSP